VGPERIYETPASEFSLSRIVVGPYVFRAEERRGAEILLCTDGQVTVDARESMTLAKGASLFVSARDGVYEASGRGTLFRATVGLV
jgi:mannose-6-phosphate isomerase